MTVDPKVFSSLRWRLVGPHRGGRVVAVAGDPVDPMTFYFGACAGGVWKTTDGGTTWENVSDGFFRTSAVGAIAVAPSDPNVIYVGTGEGCIRGNVSHGDGVYRSTDGGRTWTNLGLGDTRHVTRVRVDLKDPELVYVAALGHAFGPNRERGVFRSKNGGRTWEHVLARSERAGAADLAMDARNPRVLFAAVWQAQRSPWRMVSGGPESSLWRSTDGGDTWSDITRNPGLPRGVLGRIGVTVSPVDSQRVYAIVEAEDGALFRSDDGGATWKRYSEEAGLRGRPWYYMHVFADPTDVDTLWVLDYAAWKSVDGGKTFFEVATPHGDNHDLWIDPANPRRMIEGNDGGACVSFNGGMSWSTIYNQPTAQFYHVCADQQEPYRIYGSQQDNWAISLPSQSTRGVITQADWVQPGGGESGYITIKPTDHAIVVGGAIGTGPGTGRLIHYDHRSGQERMIAVWPEQYGMGVAAAEHRYRFQWTFPVFYSRWEPNELWIAGNHIFRSTDDGHSWETVSGDLTRNDPDKLQHSGGPVTRDNTGAEIYCTIFALVESPHERNVLWAGTDDGLVHISHDRGKTWRAVTPLGLPEWALISVIEPSPHDAGTCYVAATRYKLDDTRPYLFRTTNYGATWTRITDGIDDGEFTRVIREDPNRRGLLYVGTETGLWVSSDAGARWQRFATNLPVTPIHDAIVKGTDLVVATHGRSFWILDDLTPLHQAAPDGEAPAHLFAPRRTVLWRAYRGHGMKPALGGLGYRLAGAVGYSYRQVETPTGEKREALLDAGENPPDGVIVHYWLRDKPAGEISLTFLDASDRELRTFRSRRPDKPADTDASLPVAKTSAETTDEEPRLTTDAGSNRFVWNLRLPDAPKLPENKGRGGTVEMLAGPRVPPGAYQVRLTVDGRSWTQRFEIAMDPRVRTSVGDLGRQFEWVTTVHAKLCETHQAVLTLRDVRGQVEGWARRVEVQAVKDAARSLTERLTAIESALVQVKSEDPRMLPSKLNSRLATLLPLAEYSDAPPTAALVATYESLATRIDAELTQLERCLAQDVPAFNALCRTSNVEAIPVPDRRRSTR